MSGLAESNRGHGTHLTASHALCIVRQGSRRHPWRKSRPLQAGAKRAPGSDGHPWPTSFKVGGFVPHAWRPASRWSASATLKLEVSSLRHRKAKDALLWLRLITPNPLKGALGGHPT